MRLELTMEQAQELGALLELSLGELSHEIAATDNAGYRAELLAKRARLHEVSDNLRTIVALGTEVPDELVRELAHPGG